MRKATIWLRDLSKLLRAFRRVLVELGLIAGVLVLLRVRVEHLVAVLDMIASQFR